MSNGWIPTTERLPDQREFIESYVRSAYAAEFLVTIEGADKATTLYYSQTGVWFDEQGEPYKVVAWMPIPERYKRICADVSRKQDFLQRCKSMVCRNTGKARYLFEYVRL